MAFKRKFTNRHETILWWVKPDTGIAQPTFDVDAVRERSRELDKRNAFWGKNPGNVWEVDRVAFGSTEATSHIAVYPEEIAEKIVRACTAPDDLVLDPFSGSGTTPKVARSLGRRWIGIELSPVYAEESARRIGFQQPSEVHSLASHLTKRRVFGGQRSARTRTEVVDGLRQWSPELDLFARRSEYEALIREVFPQGLDAPEVKTAKPDVWGRFDRLLDGDASDPIVEVDQLLAADYRNRRNLNGPFRFRTALETAERLATILDSATALEFVGEMLINEPSSYLVDQDRVHLLQTQKLTKSVAEGWADFIDGLRQDLLGKATPEAVAAWSEFALERAGRPIAEEDFRELLSEQAMFGETRMKSDELGSNLFWLVRDEVVRVFGGPARVGHRQVFALVARALGDLGTDPAGVFEASDPVTPGSTESARA
jgi:hypothetical protein